MLPVNPNVFDAKPASVAGLAQDGQGSLVIYRTLVEWGLQAGFARTSHMKMADVGTEWFDATFRHAQSNKVSVIESKGEPRNRLY